LDFFADAGWLDIEQLCWEEAVVPAWIKGSFFGADRHLLVLGAK